MPAAYDIRADHEPASIRRRLSRPPAESVLGDVMLGGVDGLVTTFAVIAGSSGGRLPVATVLILGVANLLADGFSMAASNYLGTRSRQQSVRRARAEEARQIQIYPEGERREIREIYARKGLDDDTIDRVVAQITANPTVWIETMLAEELRLSDSVVRPLRAALATFAAFFVCGLVPLLPYLSGQGGDPLVLSATVAMVGFFVLGLGKGLVLGQHWLRSGLVTLAIGGTAALLAYAVGVGLHAAGFAAAT
jgi:VIT1/CCC1 family predicted Fe2+/Mn2+ transporter